MELISKDEYERLGKTEAFFFLEKKADVERQSDRLCWWCWNVEGEVVCDREDVV